MAWVCTRWSEPVYGVDIDTETRCRHYHSRLDIVAIRMRCCGAYFSCRACHDELTSHPAQTWSEVDWHVPAILCGHCGTELSIRAYIDGLDQCPACQAGFNPGCRAHRQLYFAGFAVEAGNNSGDPDPTGENRQEGLERIKDDLSTGA
jgi:uncharacterized CHY-type Zn-finger protein